MALPCAVSGAADRTGGVSSECRDAPPNILVIMPDDVGITEEEPFLAEWPDDPCFNERYRP
jgi:hypothetical protein